MEDPQITTLVGQAAGGTKLLVDLLRLTLDIPGRVVPLVALAVSFIMVTAYHIYHGGTFSTPQDFSLIVIAGILGTGGAVLLTEVQKRVQDKVHRDRVENADDQSLPPYLRQNS